MKKKKKMERAYPPPLESARPASRRRIGERQKKRGGPRASCTCEAMRRERRPLALGKRRQTQREIEREREREWCEMKEKRREKREERREEREVTVRVEYSTYLMPAVGESMVAERWRMALASPPLPATTDASALLSSSTLQHSRAYSVPQYIQNIRYIQNI